jgi:hypothetical protein
MESSIERDEFELDAIVARAEHLHLVARGGSAAVGGRSDERKGIQSVFSFSTGIECSFRLSAIQLVGGRRNSDVARRDHGLVDFGAITWFVGQGKLGRTEAKNETFPLVGLGGSRLDFCVVGFGVVPFSMV